jgi:hypothetical protein
VIVRAFEGPDGTSRSRTTTSADGSFELREAFFATASLPRAVVAERADGSACSYPAFVDNEPYEGTRWTVLRLRAGVRVTGRILALDGRPLPGGECVARWLLPAGSVLNGEDVGAAAPRVQVVRADAHGEFVLSVPLGILDIAARRDAGSPLGVHHRTDISVEEFRTPDLVVGGDDAQVSLLVQRRDGSPVEGAIAVLPQSLQTHFALSPTATDEIDGGLRAPVSGLIRIVGIEKAAPPFHVAVGSKGMSRRRILVRPGIDEMPLRVVLDPKPWVEVRLVTPAGAMAPAMAVSWWTKELLSGGDDATPDEHPVDEDDAMALLRDLVPDVEAESLDGGAACRLSARFPGLYSALASLPGRVRIAGDVTVGHGGSKVALPLPPGRFVTLRFRPGPSEDVGYPWRLRVRASVPHGDGPEGSKFEIPLWRPTTDEPTTSFWCPAEVPS